jgi:hypothetical protein
MNTTREERLQMAQTILAQMGGTGKLRAMVGATVFLALDAGVQFSFKGSDQANTCVVKYDEAFDLYTMELWAIQGASAEKVFDVDGLYFDMLVDTFEDETGLYLSL